MRAAAICGGLFTAGLVGVLCYGSSAATSKSNDVTQFGGKYLAVNEKPGGNLSPVIPLTDPELKELRGHAFIVGKIVAPNDVWKKYDGKTIWIAMDNVVDVFDFKEFDELKAMYNDPPTPSVQKDRCLDLGSPSASDPHLLDEREHLCTKNSVGIRQFPLSFMNLSRKRAIQHKKPNDGRISGQFLNGVLLQKRAKPHV